MAHTSYATTSDLASSVNPKLLTGVSTDVQQACLDRAGAELDAYLENQFELPLLAWGADITGRVCDAAVWYIIQWRGFAPEGSDTVFRQRYEDFLAWARRVSSGQLPVRVTDSTANLDAGGPMLTTGQYGNLVDGGGVATGPASSFGFGYEQQYPWIAGGAGRRGY